MFQFSNFYSKTIMIVDIFNHLDGLYGHYCGSLFNRRHYQPRSVGTFCASNTTLISEAGQLVESVVAGVQQHTGFWSHVML